MKTKLILVGGFLGAGKTTLLWSMAKRLSEQGRKVGLISNDQASELVDTAFLEQSGGVTAEVHGSCFCCNFNGFVEAIVNLRDQHQVDVIIAEPVGSCTDLSATIMQPLKDRLKDELEIAPLTVLIDPVNLRGLLEKKMTMHADAAYILQKQLEEADQIVISKTDLLEEPQISELLQRASKEWAEAELFAISALTGSNMDSWLNSVLSSTKAGTHLLQIDYDRYAEGEAALGWLNTTVQLEADSADWSVFAEQLLHDFSQEFQNQKAVIGHVKLFIEGKEAFVSGNITGTCGIPSVRGSYIPDKSVKMTLNARVELSPEHLKQVVEKTLKTCCGQSIRYSIAVMNCLRPGRPDPTFRYQEIVL